MLIFIVRTASHFAEAMRLAGADLIASAGNASSASKAIVRRRPWPSFW